MVGASGAFDYAGTRNAEAGVSWAGTSQGWNYGNMYMNANSNKNFIFPPRVAAGTILCSGGVLRFAKRNPLMCDWAGIGVGEFGKTPINYSGASSEVYPDGQCTWSRTRLQNCSYPGPPPVNVSGGLMATIWEATGGERYGMGIGALDLPIVSISGGIDDMAQNRMWYESWMANRRVNVYHAGNTDVFVPIAADLADTAKEKFNKLAEEVEYSSEKDFTTKIDTIKESYFGKKVETSGNEIDDVAAGESSQPEDLSNAMAAYTAAISKTKDIKLSNK